MLIKTALEGDEFRLSAMGRVITEIWLLLMSEFVSYSVNVCPRFCNKVVDTLAANGHRVSSGTQSLGMIYLNLLRI